MISRAVQLTDVSTQLYGLAPHALLLALLHLHSNNIFFVTTALPLHRFPIENFIIGPLEFRTFPWTFPPSDRFRRGGKCPGENVRIPPVVTGTVFERVTRGSVSLWACPSLKMI